jgi:GNAT superfamily N-acetyltransferase
MGAPVLGSLELRFRPFDLSDRSECLALFDANCPTFFAPNERDDYESFLSANHLSYKVCLDESGIVGAFGVYPIDSSNAALHWILLAPDMHGRGLGSAIMGEAIREMEASGRSLLHISASHKSAPFFERFGANALSMIPNGWGPGMHRVEMQLAIRGGVIATP